MAQSVLILSIGLVLQGTTLDCGRHNMVEFVSVREVSVKEDLRRGQEVKV